MKCNKGVHIGFSGIDGAGKTTQMNLLCGWLRKEKGLAVARYEETRYFVSEMSYIIGRSVGVKSGHELLGIDAYMIAISFEVLRNKMEKIDSVVNSGFTVVSSRSVFDWLAGARANGCSEDVYESVKNILLYLDPPKLNFWLDTDPKIADERITRRGYDASSVTFLKQYRYEFERLASEHKLIRIDGNDGIEIVHNNIINALSSKNIL